MLQVMYEPSMRHASMVLSMEWQATIVTAFANIMQQPSSASTPADATVRVTTAHVATRTDAVKQARSDTTAALPAHKQQQQQKQQQRRQPHGEAAAGGVRGGQHVCAHPYNRLCSDCLAGCQLSQVLPDLKSDAQQLHGSKPAGKQQRRQHSQTQQQAACGSPELTTASCPGAAARICAGEYSPGKVVRCCSSSGGCCGVQHAA